MKTLQFLFFTLFIILQASRISAQEDNKVFKNPNPKEMAKKISVDTILYKYQYEPIVQELNCLRNDIKCMEAEITLKNVELAKLRELGVDDFLNLTDTTIFGSSFLKISLDKIASRSKDFYLLIQDIHELNLLLTEMENMSIAQLSNIENKLINARDLIDDINFCATNDKRRITDFLSEEQKQYFRNLVGRFNKLNALINPQ